MASLRFVLLGCICLALPSAVLAQESQNPVSFGLQAGLDVADLSGADKDFAPHDRFGLIGGGFLKVSVSDRVALQLEVLYSPKGGEENTDRNPDDPADQFSVDYIELPLLFKVALSGSGVRPEIFAGPSIGFELDCTYDAFPNGQSDPVACSDAGIETRSVDLGVAFGAGIQIPAGSGYFVIDGRGIVGLRSIDESDEDLDIRNRILAVMVGYRFPL